MLRVGFPGSVLLFVM